MIKKWGKVLLFIAHFAYLYWIAILLGRSGTWNLENISLHFFLIALAGGLLIFVSKKHANL